jgi:hypothetical protein
MRRPCRAEIIKQMFYYVKPPLKAEVAILPPGYEYQCSKHKHLWGFHRNHTKPLSKWKIWPGSACTYYGIVV